MKSYTYVIENIAVSELTAYVGKANDPYKRFEEHFDDVKSSRPRFTHSHLTNALRKYGRHGFILHVVEVSDSEEQAYALEKEWVSYLKTMGVKLYNKSSGGYGGQTRSTPESTRAKMSASHKKRMQSADVRKMISDKLKGLVKSDSTREKLSITKQKAVEQLDRQGNLIASFPSAMIAAKTTGALRSKICLCCKGKRNTAGGYRWRFESGDV